MPDEVVDSILATVAAEQATETADTTQEIDVQPEAATEQKQTETTEPDKAETQEAEAKDTVEFPKKALNAISRRDKKIGKISAELEAVSKQNQEILAKLAKYERPQPQFADEWDEWEYHNPEGPKQAGFDNMASYLKAVGKYEALKETPQQKQPTQEEIAEYQRTVAAVETMKVQEAELLKTYPDYHEVEAEYQDLIDSAPPELVRLFLEVENAPLAFYTLAKQGKLESLVDMPLHKAALEIGKAIAVGLPQPKKVSSAPRPIQANTGTGTGSKSIEQMDWKEILASVS